MKIYAIWEVNDNLDPENLIKITENKDIANKYLENEGAIYFIDIWEDGELVYEDL
jgi:hypothetical protein